MVKSPYPQKYYKIGRVYFLKLLKLGRMHNGTFSRKLVKRLLGYTKLSVKMGVFLKLKNILKRD